MYKSISRLWPLKFIEIDQLALCNSESSHGQRKNVSAVGYYSTKWSPCLTEEETPLIQLLIQFPFNWIKAMALNYMSSILIFLPWRQCSLTFSWSSKPLVIHKFDWIEYGIVSWNHTLENQFLFEGDPKIKIILKICWNIFSDSL